MNEGVQTQTTRRPQRAGEKPVVAAAGLTKVFKDFWLRSRARAVDGIDFSIERGEIFGLLGPNGSGKSTTIKMILGLLKKSSGRLLVFGRSPFDVGTKKRIGFLPEESYLYPFLNARETLDYYAKLFRLERRTRQRRIDELLDMVGLSAVQHRQVREYSKGMQRRIGIAQALINDPEFLILDEPTTGLDPIGTRQVKDLILTLGERGKTILLSSHLLSDVEDVVSRMVILYGGKIRAQGTCEELLEKRSASIIETDRLSDEEIQELQRVLESRQKSVARITAPRQRLEDLFIDIVENARVERVATSGADQGQTAAFLTGEPEKIDGASLIDSLVSEDAQTPTPTMPVETEAAAPSQEQASVIDDLLREASAQPDAEPVQPQQADAADGAPPKDEPKGDVDDDVISSLLDDDEKKSGSGS
ncbi:MAG: ATP-binding cassette domain-containing protein [Planctomycetota bacterium]